MAPAPIHGGAATRVGFISYFKGEYKLQSIELAEPMKEVEQEVQVASEDLVDFQPDVTHQVVTQNKRKKHLFEKLFLEGRPPLNVGVTSGGDFFGGSQIALADVLGDKNFTVTALSLREFRSYEGTYLDLGHRFQYGFTAFDNTQFFYASPYALQQGFFREGAFATQRVHRRPAHRAVPARQVQPRSRSTPASSACARGSRTSSPSRTRRRRRRRRGPQFFLNNGNIAPLSLSLVGETTRFREFGPLDRRTPIGLGLTYAPGVNGFLSRQTIEVDARKYIRLGGSGVLAARVRGFTSMGDAPDIFYFGGNMELRGYPYLSFVGNQGFFANLELRIPIIDLMKTPIGILGPVRGTLYAGIGEAKIRGDNSSFGTSASPASPTCAIPSSASPSPATTWWTDARPTASASSSSSWAIRCTSTGRS